MIFNHPPLPIRFQYADISFHFRHHRLLKQVLLRIFFDNRTAFASLDYIFCSDNFLLEINERFLLHEDLTDIITFDLASTKSSPAIGEIYISIDRVYENAHLFKVSRSNELARVIFHGALHLCGFKDKKPAHRVEMKTQEDFYLAVLEDLIVSRGTSNR